MFYQEKAKRENPLIEDGSSDGLPESTTPATRRDAGSQHPHRQALKGIFKSPSISKLSSHLPTRQHQHGASTTTPLSSPPTMDRPAGPITSGSKIPDQESLLPPPSVPQATVSDSILESPTVVEGATASDPAPMPDSKHSWKLKGVVAVIRHADRSKCIIRSLFWWRSP